MFSKKFEAIFGHLATVSETENSGLPAIFLTFQNGKNNDFIFIAIRMACQMIFPKKIVNAGILIDDKSSSETTVAEIRYSTNREQRRLLASTLGDSKFDLKKEE